LIFRSRNEVANRPKTIKLFVNKANIDFDHCENDIPEQKIVLGNADFNGSTEL